MLALYIILGIIAFFVLLLSIKVRIESEYIDDFEMKLKWLFLEFTIYPFKPKTPKKKEENKVVEEKAEEEVKQVKPNPFKTFYDNQGFEGVIQLIKDSADALGSMMRSMKKHFIIDDLYLWIVVSKNHDAAGTAIEYGNICKTVFPSMGYICSTLKVKRYDVNVEPDFIGTLSSAQFAVNFSFRPLFLINSGIAFAIRMLFKVVFKVLFAKPVDESSENKDLQNIKGGATQ